jgi:hypothetical protein
MIIPQIRIARSLKKIVLGCPYLVHFVVLFGVTMYICVQYILFPIYNLSIHKMKDISLKCV